MIYLDPPFNSNRHYSAPIGSRAAGAEFKDAWAFEDTDAAWWGELAEEHEPLYRVIDAAGAAGGDGNKAYLIYMAMRLLELRRILKPTGSIYLHCDPTMSHPLKMAMDAIFGPKNFLNEIIWCYSTGGRSTTSFPQKHDVILRYGQTIDAVFYYDNVALPRDFSTMHETILTDEEGRNYQRNIKAGKEYRYYLDKGVLPNDWWVDIQALNPSAKERLGYPTQKPLKLLDRIIKASSNNGDVVLDPFCGCATTCIAAEALNRQWVGIDISPMAVNLLETRMKENYELELGGKLVRSQINHRTDIPVRDAPPRSRNIKHILFGQQEGLCKGCKTAFPFSNFTLDHIVPKAKGGPDTDDNLQLLCNYCNSVKGTRTMEYLLTKLAKQ